MDYLFYTPSLEPGDAFFQLDETESKHAVRVLRLKEGDSVRLVDGRGGLYEAVMEDAHPKRAQLSIRSVEENYQRLPYRLHLAVAPTKSMDRFEWFVEKATEIGVHEITPLICARSERRDLKLERIVKVAIAAMKQSQKAFLPVIHAPVKFADFLERLPEADTDCVDGSSCHRFIAHCVPGEKRFMQSVATKGDSILILIGPEGDFHSDEIREATAKGFIAVSLGESRLRTETAALAACMEVSLLNR